jgi:hypothetical protein
VLQPPMSHNGRMAIVAVGARTVRALALVSVTA